MPESSHIRPHNLRKSSYSGSTTQNCVQMGDLPGGAAVGDTQNPADGFLTFPASEWQAALGALAEY